MNPIHRRCCLAACWLGAELCLNRAAFAVEPIGQTPADAASAPASSAPAPLGEAPVVGVTHSARAPSQRGYGASAFVSGSFALSGELPSESQLGGGLRLWATPLDGFSLLAEAQRRDNGELAPSLAAQVRIWHDERWALGALGRFKSEGFAEIEGELELGLLGSYDAGGNHLDLNAVVGRGFEEAETDGELALRVGRELLGSLRAGVEGRLRYRIGGDVPLPGGRQWDVFGGPELGASFAPFFASLLTGPTTVGVVSGVGWQSLLTFGGVM